MLSTNTNQPFMMHFKHVRIPISSPYLLLLLGPRFFLTPMWESDFDLGFRKKNYLSMPLDNSFSNTHYVCDAIS
jgi:hypothetical protein